AAIDPNSAPIISPRSPENTVRIAALPDQTNPSSRVHGASLSAHVVRRTGDHLSAASAPRLPAPTGSSVLSSSANLKIGSAPPTTPNPFPVVAPAAPKTTGRVTAFADELNSPTRVGRTPVATAIIGRAIDVVPVVPPAPI